MKLIEGIYYLLFFNNHKNLIQICLTSDNNYIQHCKAKITGTIFYACLKFVKAAIYKTKINVENTWSMKSWPLAMSNFKRSYLLKLINKNNVTNIFIFHDIIRVESFLEGVIYQNQDGILF